VTNLAGVDLDALSEGDWGGYSLPPIEPDLVHLCDADIGAYEVADLEKTDVENYQDFIEWIEHRRLLCGAYRSIPFITMGNKGGRYALAVVKEYQGNRSKHRDPELVSRVHALRALLAERDPRCVVGELEEADDLLTQYQYASLRGTPSGTVRPGERTVLDSNDKDLRMSAGLHIDPKTLEFVEVSGYGSIWIEDQSSTKKLLGWGTAFFWSQLLTGDTADNIPGLPLLPGELANVYQPTKTILAANARIQEGGTEKQIRAAEAKLAGRKPLKVGPVLAYAVLKDAGNDYEAMRRVRDAYYAFYGPGTFDVPHWRGHTVRRTAGHMLLEQARLLWMRRVPGECVSTFFKEVVAKHKYEEKLPWD
jgi:hypothetical protein